MTEQELRLPAACLIMLVADPTRTLSLRALLLGCGAFRSTAALFA